MEPDGLERARVLLDLGRWDDALAELAPSLADPSAGAEPWCLAAVCELARERWPEALDAASRAVSVEPSNPWAYRLVARAQLGGQRPLEAVEPVRRALDLDPESCETLDTAVAVFLVQPAGRGAAEAEHLVRRMLELHPDRALAWEAAARLSVSRLAWEDAERCARRGLAIDPEDADLVYLLGLALREQGRREEAAEAFVSAGRAAPTSDVPREAIGGFSRPAVVGASLVGGVYVLTMALAMAAPRTTGTTPVWTLGLGLVLVVVAAALAAELVARRGAAHLPPALQAVARRRLYVEARPWVLGTACLFGLVGLWAAKVGEWTTVLGLGIVAAGLTEAWRRLPRSL